MEAPFELLGALLQEERAAARRADIDALMELQSGKRAVLDRIKAQKTELPAHLAELAQSNVVLLRHLVSCLEGAIGIEPQTYDTYGRRPTLPVGHARGRR